MRNEIELNYLSFADSLVQRFPFRSILSSKASVHPLRQGVGRLCYCAGTMSGVGECRIDTTEHRNIQIQGKILQVQKTTGSIFTNCLMTFNGLETLYQFCTTGAIFVHHQKVYNFGLFQSKPVTRALRTPHL
jgi:hypothetical protein